MSSIRPPTIGAEIRCEFSDEDKSAGLRRLSATSVNEFTYKHELRKYSLSKQNGGASPAIPPRVSSNINGITENAHLYNSPTVFRKALQNVHSCLDSSANPIDGRMLSCVGHCGQRKNIENSKNSVFTNSIEPSPANHEIIQSTSNSNINGQFIYANRDPSYLKCNSRAFSLNPVETVNNRPFQKIPCPMNTPLLIHTHLGQECNSRHNEIPLNVVYARALAPFQDSSYHNMFTFEKNEIICVFVDSMSHLSNYSVNPGSTRTIQTPWWRGFRANQGPGATGHFPSALVSLLNQGDIPNAIMGQSHGPPSRLKVKKHLDYQLNQRNKAVLVDLAIQTDTPPPLDESSCSTNDSVDENDEDSNNECSLDDNHIGLNGNEETLQLDSGMMMELEKLAQRALNTTLSSSKNSPDPIGFKPKGAPHGSPQHNPTQLGVESEKRNISCVSETFYVSSRDSATSLDSGRGSAYTNSSDAGKPESQLPADEKKHNIIFSRNVSPRHAYSFLNGRNPANDSSHCAVKYDSRHVNASSPISNVSGSSDSSDSRGSNMNYKTVPYEVGGMQSQTAYRKQDPLWRTQASCGCSCSNSSPNCSTSVDASSCGSCTIQRSFISLADRDIPQLPDKINENIQLMENWLHSAGFSDCIPCLIASGYDLETLSRATPEDLNACGITNPHDRQRLRIRLGRLQLPESLPDSLPESVQEWLEIMNLSCYWPDLKRQGFIDFHELASLTWEDLEDIGIKKLGHQKKMTLAIEKLKRMIPNHPGNKIGRLAMVQEGQSGRERILASNRWSEPKSVQSNEIFAETSASVADIDEDSPEACSTPPPPPAFQDPPISQPPATSNSRRTSIQSNTFDSGRQIPVLRELSLDAPVLQYPPTSPRNNCNEHYSVDNISEIINTVADVREFSYLQTALKCDSPDLNQTESIVNSSDPASFIVDRNSSFPIRKNVHLLSATTVPVCHGILPALSSNCDTDPDIQDMNNLRSMLDELSAHLVQNRSV